MNRLRAAAQREQHGLHLPGPCLPLPPSLLLHLLHGLPPGHRPSSLDRDDLDPDPAAATTEALAKVDLSDDPDATATATAKSAAPASPVIAINKEFPGPVVNVTTNYNVAVNVLNSLDEPLLITWDGIQQRKNCWQDGVLGTNCPIPPGWNWTYNFQVMDDACKSLDYPEDQTCAFSSVSSDISAAMLFYLYSVWSGLWFLDGLGYPIYLSFIS
ncbi:hypothetical protein CFC21_012679 [Triticum aestivum]|uniref:Plastocyanin-like domain-containing protein n=2 Tax=Triticum aestivum TaxID=4565 RepID=A0A3B5ZX97_WHEAT|nr:hypothetical protein CFC21_012679 [Triticum aestivum]